jgi:cytosine/adenosine deaminase-related metal-dependent hydrolase
MRTLEHISPEWAIKNVTFFDHDTHSFVEGDIEIDGQRIAAIRTAGSSAIRYAIDGRDHVCTPGLVLAQTNWPATHGEPHDLLRRGVTTVAATCRTASECILAASQSKVRLVIHWLLDANRHAREGQLGLDERELHMFARIADCVGSNSALILPALHCASVVSAAELVYAQQFASALKRRLVLVLSESNEAAQAFRERFFCSETQLLAFMRLLEPNVTVIPGQSLSDRDTETLLNSGVRIVGRGAGWPRPLAYRRVRSIGASPCIDGFSSCCDDARSMAQVPAPTVSANVRCENADAVVDALTVGAGADVGETDCGRIAAGMRADLCMFRSTGTNLQGLGSQAFLKLIRDSEPDCVMIGGSRHTFEVACRSER